MKLLKFQADWCGPCKALTTLMADLNFPYEVQVVNIDEEEELVTKYNIRGIPTLILLGDNGEIVETNTGMMSKADLEAKFL